MWVVPELTLLEDLTEATFLDGKVDCTLQCPELGLYFFFRKFALSY